LARLSRCSQDDSSREDDGWLWQRQGPWLRPRQEPMLLTKGQGSGRGRASRGGGPMPPKLAFDPPSTRRRREQRQRQEEG
jgi:hypothetical protein